MATCGHESVTSKPSSVCGPVLQTAAEGHSFAPCAACSLGAESTLTPEARNYKATSGIEIGVCHNLEVAPAVELEITVGNVGCVDNGCKRGTVLAP